MQSFIGVRLEGGLGNVMFQYARARRASIKLGVPIRYDVTSYATNPLGDYSFTLEWFGIPVAPHRMSEQDIRSFERYRKHKGAFAWMQNALYSNEKRYVEERGYCFQPDQMDVEPPVYLRGWWQSEKYFADIRKELIRDFTTTKLTERSNAYASLMTKTESVSVHLRRLDYVSNPKTRASHGELSMRYYEHALALIAERKKNLHLFIFSDDIAWAEDTVRFPHPMTFIESNMKTPQEDLILMSRAHHNVVANSSFSWWGAWLNDNSSKIVVAPNQWVRKFKSESTRDVVPESWEQIPPYWNN